MDQQKTFPSKIFDIIQEIANLSVGGNYLFRGEPKHHCKISSTLYRECQRVVQKLGLEGEFSDFNIKAIEEEILKQVNEFIPRGEQALDLSIFTQLQHYGSQTNLIDFTTDLHIALFFACDGQPGEDGRVILQKRNLVPIKHPSGVGHRILAQKSVFVQPERGYIDPNESQYEVVCIPACLKEDILRYLQNTHGITTETIYNDIHGYIRNKGIHELAYGEMYIAFIYQGRAEEVKDEKEKHELWDKAIEHYGKAIGYNPNIYPAYTNRLTLHSKKRENDSAMQYRLKELEINPDRAPGPYTDRDHKAEWMLTQDPMEYSSEKPVRGTEIPPSGGRESVPPFEVVSSPNDWSPGVSRDTRRAASQELSDKQQWRIRYWTGLRDFMIDNGSGLKCRTPRDSSDFRFSIGRTYFTIYACLASREREISIQLYMAGDFAKAHYHLLKEQQKKIHNEFDETLEWDERPENTRSRISLSKAGTDPLDENDWPHQYAWFTTKLERFNQVFRPRIRTLNAADWIPEDDAP